MRGKQNKCKYLLVLLILFSCHYICHAMLLLLLHSHSHSFARICFAFILHTLAAHGLYSMRARVNKNANTEKQQQQQKQKKSSINKSS